MCRAFLLWLTKADVMLVNMKHIILTSLLLIALPFGFTAHAELYKGLDEEGNIIYSDKPFDDAQTFTLPPLTIVDPPKVQPKKEIVEEKKIAETKYTAFSIISPTDQQVIWNEPNLTVTLMLKPALNTEEGHNIWLQMDGKTLVKNSQQLSLQIGRADRGEHKIQAQIRNKKGKIIKRSPSVTVHIKHTTISRQPRNSQE